MQSRVCVGFLGSMCTLPAHVQFLSIQVSQVLLPRAAFNPSIPQFVLVLGITQTQVHDLKIYLAELHEVHKDHSSRLSRFPWMESHASLVWQLNHSAWYNLADLLRVLSVPPCIAIDEDTKQHWTLYGPLRSTIFYFFLLGHSAIDCNSGCDHLTTSLSVNSPSFKSITL